MKCEVWRILFLNRFLTLFRASAAFNIKYVSEVEEPEFETVVLPGANFNTEQGHCQKTEAILHYFNRNAKANNW